LLLLPLCFAHDWSPLYSEDPFRPGQLRALLLVAALIVMVGGPLAALLSYAGIMWVLHDYPAHGLEHLAYFLAALFVAFALHTDKRVAQVLAYLGAAQAVFGLAEFVGWNFWGYNEPDALNMPTGFYGQQTILGAFLVATLAPALFTGRRLCAFLILLCALATRSTMTAAGCGAISLLWLLREYGKRTFLTTVLLAVLALAAFYLQDPDNPLLSPNGRLGFWAIGWQYHRLRPTFGWGPGSWAPMAPTAPPIGLRVESLHNEYLEFLVEYGWAGFALLLLNLWGFAKGFKLTWHHALCAGLLVNAIGNFPFHIASLGVIFLTGWLLSVRDIL
jgi:O-antigen ligase